MKAVLSNRIFMNSTPELQEKLKKELMYVLPPRTPTGVPETIYDVTKVSDSIISIPIGRIDLIPKNYEIIDKRAVVPAYLPELKVRLRPSQEEVYNDLKDNAIINAQPGWGKTFVGLAIANKLQQKTLVIVHTVSLRDQWAREVKKMYGIEPGIIGSGKLDTDSPIVIANVQTLSKIVHKLDKAFGTVIMDETHHLPATTFKNILDKLKCRYKIGLSATLNRKDGKGIMLPDYLGLKIYRPEVENKMTPEVYIVETDLKIPGNTTMPWATRVNKLVENQLYRNLVLNLAKHNADLGHKVLVPLDRVELIEWCASQVHNSIAVTGKTDNRVDTIKKIYTKDIDIIFGSSKIFSEGISEDILSCLVIGQPIGDNHSFLEQLIGRITRPYTDKLTPRVIDIGLAGTTGKNQLTSRINYYMQKGYKIHTV